MGAFYKMWQGRRYARQEAERERNRLLEELVEKYRNLTGSYEEFLAAKDLLLYKKDDVIRAQRALIGRQKDQLLVLKRKIPGLEEALEREKTGGFGPENEENRS